MTQFADDIRRIARGNRKKGPLGIYTERDPVPGGTVFLVTNPDLLNGNAPAVSDGSNSPEQQEQADEDKNKETDPNNPNTFNKGGTGTGDSAQQEGVADIGDAIDGTAGPQMPTTGGGTSGLGGIRELTGLKDCDSGKEFNLHLDGNFVPPEGWDDPDTPPLEGPAESFVPGFKWGVDGGVIAAIHPSSYAAAMARVASSETSIAIVGGPDTSSFASDGRHRYVISTTLTQFPTVEISCFGVACTPSVNNAECPVEQPSASSWPQDNIYDVAIKDGQFQTNEFDADAPENFEPSGTKNFCYDSTDEAGNPVIKNGKALVTADGGVMYYQTNEAGAPTGTVRVLDSAGQLQAAGTATESFISQYLPQ